MLMMMFSSLFWDFFICDFFSLVTFDNYELFSPAKSDSPHLADFFLFYDSPYFSHKHIKSSRLDFLFYYFANFSGFSLYMALIFLTELTPLDYPARLLIDGNFTRKSKLFIWYKERAYKRSSHTCYFTGRRERTENSFVLALRLYKLVLTVRAAMSRNIFFLLFDSRSSRVLTNRERATERKASQHMLIAGYRIGFECDARDSLKAYRVMFWEILIGASLEAFRVAAEKLLGDFSWKKD